MKILLLCLGILASGLARGQSLPPASSAIHLGYSGELLGHPGFQLGYEYVLKDWAKTNRKNKVRQKSWLLHGTVSHLRLVDTRSTTFLEPGIYLRTLKTKGWTRQWNLRLGLAYLENAGTTYVQQTNGDPESFRFIGNSYGTVSLGYGWGYDFRASQSLPFAAYVQPRAGLLFPYNTSLLPFVRVEIGLRYYLHQTASS